ncbi:Inner spore coat protein H [compost metagenome]
MKLYKMKSKTRGCILSLLAMVIVVTGCTTPSELPVTEGTDGVKELGVNSSYIPKLVDNRSIYANDKADSIVHFYITVTDDNLTAEKPMTWENMNKVRLSPPTGDADKMNVIIQEGDEKGPSKGMFGHSAVYPNATVALRGKSTLKARQKSYKLDLTDNAGKWREQKTINLIKHAFDFSRIRNKLSFDYFKQLSDFTSLRTQFVNLHVKDLTSGAASDKFVDYGLYTQIEQPNKSFLRAHGLDPNAQLYKPANFEFRRYANALKLSSDSSYDKEAFESVLEIKGSNDHTKLLNMLDDLNNMELDPNKVVEKYFDRDNFLTWMGVNIIMDNMDTITQNFLLYSPTNSEKWFFLPWDYDGAWGFQEQYSEAVGERPEWQKGITNFWGSVLQRRFFRDSKNIEDLTEKVRSLSTIINPEQSRKLIESYLPIVNSYIRREPDIRDLPGPIAKYPEEIERIIQQSVENEKIYLSSIQKPMPIFLGVPVKSGSDYEFTWDMSYDLQSDELTYTFELAKEPTFAKPLVRRLGLVTTETKISNLVKGQYFWRVKISDDKGNEMIAFDEYQDANGNKFHGIREVYLD